MISEETLAAHAARLAEIRNLVSENATAIVSDVNTGGKVDTLCRRLKGIKESLTILADVTQSVEKIKTVVEMSVLENFNTLTNLHNETLSNIMDRHVEVKNRLNSWERYRHDQNRLLAWLKDSEHLELRYIHIGRVAKVLNRIQQILNNIPQGVEQAEQLLKQQNRLLQCNDDALSELTRIEHAAVTQRISNLQAGVGTWLQFLERISKLIKDYDDKIQKVQSFFDNVQEVITNHAQDPPSSHSSVINRLENLRQTRNLVTGLIIDLEQLDVMQEYLKECVTPMDMKTISQRMWLLWHQQDDLDHQLGIICQQLEQSLGLKSAFEAHHTKFISWTNDLEKRFEEVSKKGGDTIRDPEELFRKLDTELMAQMALKKHEYVWLTTTGTDLVNACGEDYSDVVAKQNIATRTNEVYGRWKHLQSLGMSKINKIQDMTQTITQLEVRIAEIKSWLHQMEVRLAEPLVFERCNKETFDRLRQEHDKLKNFIEKESGNIGHVINLCELLLSHAESCGKYYTTEFITSAMQNIEKRWKNVCVLSAEKQRKITFVSKLLQEILRITAEQEDWLTEQETKLNHLDKFITRLSNDRKLEQIYKIENLIKDIESRAPTFEVLEQTYSKLVKTNGLDPQNINKLTTNVRKIIMKWHDVSSRLNRLLQSLQSELSIYKEFRVAHGNAIMGLTRVNAQLTELQHLEIPTAESPPENRFKELEDIEQAFTAQNENLENVDKLGLLIMQKTEEYEINIIQQMIDEYRLLWQDIQERIVLLKSELQTEILQNEYELDKSVQLATLKFKQDTAVQVNTLSPQLQCMTSISANHAYMVELTSAIGECCSNIKSLRKIVEREIPQQRLPELRSATGGVYSFLCEHEAGRFLCPLCTKRNWAQLDNDLRRLEQWLQAAEGIQGSQHSTPSNIEQLEDMIQDHREFLLDLDSHKSIIRSLNIVGTYLADHSDDNEKADNLRERLEKDNKSWENVCLSATTWQNILQRALMDNRQFHLKIEELRSWLEKTENQICTYVPVDLTANIETVHAKFESFCAFMEKLKRFEPRVLSLQESANQLLKNDEAPDSSTTICMRLSELRLKLHSLIRLTGITILKLGALLGCDLNEIGLALASSPTSAGPTLHSFTYNLLDPATAPPGPFAIQDDRTYTGTADDDNDASNTTVLRRSYRFLGRVIRASLPIQAIVLLLLGVASLMSSTEEDYACLLATNLANTFTPLLHYPQGPPPV